MGTGTDCSIKALVETVAEVIGYEGEIAWDTSKPDGAPRKLMDSSKLNQLGWTPSYDLKAGLTHTYDWYLSNIDSARS